MAQTSSGSIVTPFLDDQRETKQTKGDNHSTTNLQNKSQTSISMARNKGNNHDETKQVQDSNIVMIDRISNLPHSIILHILSLLPTVEVIRTSLISKRWRHLWNSVPALEFCDVGIEEQKFYNFVNKCLEHRMIGKRRLNDLGINRFKLEMHCYGGRSVDVDRWLSFAVQQHLEELDLCIQPNTFRMPSFYYCIPSLTVLKLDGLELANEVFYNLIMGCPSLEKLFLRDCSAFCDLKVSSLNLRVLVLKRTTIEDDEDEWDDNMVITFNTPSLVSFHYEDVNFTCKVLLNSPNLEEANIKLDYYGLRKKIDMNWYFDMIDFLSYFDCAKVVSLFVYSEENLMFPEKLRKFCRSPLPNVKHLKVETRCELKSESLLRDALLWLSPHTQTLSIRSEENKARS